MKLEHEIIAYADAAHSVLFCLFNFFSPNSGISLVHRPDTITFESACKESDPLKSRDISYHSGVFCENL